jgi:hypothetical protein
MRTLLTPIAIALFAVSAAAQTLTANFEIQSEGWFAQTYAENGLTFQNLDQAFPGGGNYVFTIEQADGTLAGQPGFTPTNTLGFGGYSPGPGVGFSRCKSFEIVWGGLPANEAQIEVYEFANAAGNTVTLEALVGTSVVASDTFTFGGGFVVTHHTLHVQNALFDSLRVVGGGASDGGVFFAVVDTLRVEVGDTGTLFCAGDGSATACPCGNASTVGDDVGCLNSIVLGGKLRASGMASLSADTLELEGSQMPNSSALYFQGTSQLGGGAGSVFGDGLRCAGGTITRLGTKSNVAGSSEYPDVGDPSISVRGLVTTPGTRTYQVWYRNAASFCTSSTFNLTNGIEVTWS